ncbi:hypothetical protein [Argonema galeatum]|uniref:hypothetical protein n=1 Tax=Argonema galeatum TaxID=2942762 RepID=UPI00201260BF|nr:hypothetical protein [Argonema galeatum]MCL1467731.1 hypothetical protein [Argonema galeatum A003/A1]
MTVNLFDVNYYRGTNPDLRTAGLTTDTQLVDHFLRFGINDGRPFSPFVNLDFYRAGNPDLAAGGVNNNLQAFYHLQSYGIADGRRFSYGLNVPFYAAVNPDLALVGINNNEQRFEHFRSAGINDGRVSAENFNVRYYLDANPDLRAAGLNFAQAFQHYVNYGFREGRPAVPGGSTPPPPQGEPGNNPGAAFNVDVLTGTRNFNEFVGFNDRDDYYRFSLQLPSAFILSLDSTTANVGVTLYQDTNGNGQIDSNEFVDDRTAFSGSTASISRTLGAGTYFVRLQPDSQGRNTNYSLGLTANNTRDGLIDGGLLNGSRTFNEFVGRTDRQDFYRFVLGSPSNFRLTLNGTTANVGVTLYVDTNGNGQIDSNEFVDDRTAFSGGSASFSRSLGADTYFVVVSTGSSSNSNYTLNLATV